MLVLRPARRRNLAALLAGVLLALGQAPLNFPYLGLLAIPFLLSMLQVARGWRNAFALGWFAGFGYFALSLSWIVEPFLVDIGRHGWMAPFALLFMAAGLALFWGLAFLLSARWMRGKWTDAVVLAGFWALAEVLRSYVFTGFPWALLAYGWVETPVIQLAAIIGVHGIGFLLVLLAGLLLWRWGAVAALSISVVSVGFGLIQLQKPVEMTAFTARLVQPNAEQQLKWQPDQIPVFYQRLLDLSVSEDPVDVVIWPEVAIAYLPDEQPFLRTEIVEVAQAPVILGARRRDDQSVYNSLFIINREGDIAGSYDKHHLVPFGEYIPLQGLASKLGLQALADVMGGGIGTGSGPKGLSADGIPAFLPLICYEVIFPQGMFAAARPEWLLQVTNDAWFGRFSGPYQHLAQARVRAIEQGLPLARVANTGVSAMIDPYGRVLESLPLGEAGFVDATLPRALQPTVFARTGPNAAILAIVLGLLTQLMIVKRHRE